MARFWRGASRREFVLGALGTVAALAGCAGTTGGDARRGAGAGGTGGVGGTGGIGGSGGAPGGSGGGNPVTGWTVGGTAAMVDAAGYPDPFVTGVSPCALTCAMTLGPCFAESPVRQDVSEGYPGLPMRLALRLVDVDGCTPVAGAEVDIWHTGVRGLYSGPDAIDFCTTGDADAKSHRFFRGTQTSDERGVVRFDTCFPGWYPGRAIHIHFRVRRGAESYVVSQLFFPEDVTKEIFDMLEGYVDRGPPDTDLSSDGVLGGADPAPYTVEVQRMSDGAMLAWKTIVLRSSTADALCTA